MRSVYDFNIFAIVRQVQTLEKSFYCRKHFHNDGLNGNIKNHCPVISRSAKCVSGNDRAAVFLLESQYYITPALPWARRRFVKSPVRESPRQFIHNP